MYKSQYILSALIWAAKAAMKEAKTLPEAGEKARELQGAADQARAEALGLKSLAKLEDLIYGSRGRSRPQRRAAGLIAAEWLLGGRAVKREMSTSGAAQRWMRKPPGRRPGR
jgi:hypothetical protein